MIFLKIKLGNLDLEGISACADEIVQNILRSKFIAVDEASTAYPPQFPVARQRTELRGHTSKTMRRYAQSFVGYRNSYINISAKSVDS